jgi:hypothetical protein
MWNEEFHPRGQHEHGFGPASADPHGRQVFWLVTPGKSLPSLFYKGSTFDEGSTFKASDLN